MQRALWVLTSLALMTTAASASCKDEVLAAFDKQRKSPAFEMAAVFAGDAGDTKLTVDYVPPDRMHQTMVRPDQPAPVETVAIGNEAWSTNGGAWEKLEPHWALAVSAQVQQALADQRETIGDFECLGTKSVEGKDYTAYRSIDAPLGDGAPEMHRTIYIDPATGLPMHNIVAEVNENAKPVFKATYAYPADLKIESPGAPAK